MPNILGYEIINNEKWDRAVNGEMGKLGQLEGGVGEGATDMKKLAAYDKLGGLVRKNGRTIKTGSFYDFKLRKPRVKPEIIFVFRSGEKSTEIIEIPEGEEVPLEIRAEEELKEKADRPKKTDVEDADEEDATDEKDEEDEE